MALALGLGDSDGVGDGDEAGAVGVGTGGLMQQMRLVGFGRFSSRGGVGRGATTSVRTGGSSILFAGIAGVAGILAGLLVAGPVAGRPGECPRRDSAGPVGGTVPAAAGPSSRIGTSPFTTTR